MPRWKVPQSNAKGGRVISFKQLSEKASAINSKINWRTRIWIGLGLLALPALRIFYVQEMLAALIGFSLLFAVIYIAVFAIFLVVRGSKPLVVWATPRVRRVLDWGAETAGGTVANPVWAKAVPHRLRSQRLKLNENCKTVYSRVARFGLSAVPKVRQAAHWSAEVAESAVTRPVWAKAVPVWAKAVPHQFRSQQLKLRQNCKTVYSGFGRLRFRPGHVYRVSLQKGGAALTMGLRTHKKISNQLGSWLTERVTYADLIRLRSISRGGSLRQRGQARPRP